VPDIDIPGQMEDRSAYRGNPKSIQFTFPVGIDITGSTFTGLIDSPDAAWTVDDSRLADRIVTITLDEASTAAIKTAYVRCGLAETPHWGDTIIIWRLKMSGPV
jgi:hypothetical protein